MKQSKAARTYAKSLLKLAVEKNVLEDVKKDMETVYQVCEESSELQSVLESPIVSGAKKEEVLNKIFKTSLSEVSYKFIELVSNNQRESLLHNMAFSFGDLYLEQKNILRAVITSVNGVGDALKTKVAELVKTSYNKEVLIEEKNDTTLIGGFVITIGDKQVDASISKQLANLHNSFS
jgi:F-type H+-transporting ATPase subunit delta